MFYKKQAVMFMKDTHQAFTTYGNLCLHKCDSNLAEVMSVNDATDLASKLKDLDLETNGKHLQLRVELSWDVKTGSFLFYFITSYFILSTNLLDVWLRGLYKGNIQENSIRNRRMGPSSL